MLSKHLPVNLHVNSFSVRDDCRCLLEPHGSLWPLISSICSSLLKDEMKINELGLREVSKNILFQGRPLIGLLEPKLIAMSYFRSSSD